MEIPKAELQAALKYLDQSRVVAYELGNEPDHYTFPHDFRPNNTWNMAAYVHETLEWLPQLSSGKKKFQYGSIAESPATPSDFKLVQALQFGVSSLEHVTIFSSHSYQGDVCTGTLSYLLLRRI